MRNLALLLAGLCCSLIVGCQSPCSGCRTCSGGGASCGSLQNLSPQLCALGNLAPHVPIVSQPGCHAASLQSAMAGSLSSLSQPCAPGSPCSTTSPFAGLGSCLTSPAGNSDSCPAAPSTSADACASAESPQCAAPSLAGGGHCGAGNGAACATKVIQDWQQSTGVDSANSQPAHCAAPIGCKGCTCQSSVGQPAADANCAAPSTTCTGTAANAQGELQCGCPNCTSQINLSQPLATIAPQTPQPHPIVATPIDTTTPTVPQPQTTTPSNQPLHDVEGTPVKGYPGVGCPVHGHSPKKVASEGQDLSHLQRPVKGSLSGALAGGGFVGGSVHNSTQATQPKQVDRISHQQKASSQGHRVQKAIATKLPFARKSKPSVTLESSGWSATAKPVKPMRIAPEIESATPISEVEQLPEMDLIEAEVENDFGIFGS